MTDNLYPLISFCFPIKQNCFKNPDSKRLLCFPKEIQFLKKGPMWIVDTNQLMEPSPFLRFLFNVKSCILVFELPVAPLGPLRKCLPLVFLHISILTPISYPPLCGRNQATSVVFEAELEARHCSRIFHCTGKHVPIVNNSVGEKVPSYLQPGCHLPQIEWAVCTSGCSPSICCHVL